VIFIEPQYTDAPVKQMSPNDDHPPTSISKGQELLLDIYNALTANPDRWSRTVLIVTYDEHGGFFDHVSPIAVPHHPAGARYVKFSTTGVRVPAFVVSPLVKRGGVFSKPLDHTSILRLIGERFGSGAGYSSDVDQRAGIGSLGEVLQSEARIDIPAPPPASNYFPDTMTSNSAAFGFAQEAMRREKKRTV
jgi:phospholipase C